LNRWLKAFIGAACALMVTTPTWAKTVCNAKDNAARVLKSPSPNDLHPDWTGIGNIGTGQGFIPKASKRTHVGLFLQGDLYSTRGGLMTPNAWIFAKEWICEKS